MGEAPGQTESDPKAGALAIYVDAPGGVSTPRPAIVAAAGDSRRVRPWNSSLHGFRTRTRAEPTAARSSRSATRASVSLAALTAPTDQRLSLWPARWWRRVLPSSISNHSCRATGITVHQENGERWPARERPVDGGAR
jgi:hypothetical protein